MRTRSAHTAKAEPFLAPYPHIDPCRVPPAPALMGDPEGEGSEAGGDFPVFFVDKVIHHEAGSEFHFSDGPRETVRKYREGDVQEAITYREGDIAQ